MLDRLSSGDNGGIQDILVGNLTGDFIAFFDQPVDGGTFDTLRLLAKLLEGLVKTFDLLLGFLEVVPEAFAQACRPCRRRSSMFWMSLVKRPMARRPSKRVWLTNSVYGFRVPRIGCVSNEFKAGAKAALQAFVMHA
jgi:hypothetical protein